MAVISLVRRCQTPRCFARQVTRCPMPSRPEVTPAIAGYDWGDLVRTEASGLGHDLAGVDLVTDTEPRALGVFNRSSVVS
jgi:hypothetical protein